MFTVDILDTKTGEIIDSISPKVGLVNSIRISNSGLLFIDCTVAEGFYTLLYETAQKDAKEDSLDNLNPAHLNPAAKPAEQKPAEQKPAKAVEPAKPEPPKEERKPPQAKKDYHAVILLQSQVESQGLELE